MLESLVEVTGLQLVGCMPSFQLLACKFLALHGGSYGSSEFDDRALVIPQTSMFWELRCACQDWRLPAVR